MIIAACSLLGAVLLAVILHIRRRPSPTVMSRVELDSYYTGIFERSTGDISDVTPEVLDYYLGEAAEVAVPSLMIAKPLQYIPNDTWGQPDCHRCGYPASDHGDRHLPASEHISCQETEGSIVARLRKLERTTGLAAYSMRGNTYRGNE